MAFVGDSAVEIGETGGSIAWHKTFQTAAGVVAALGPSWADPFSFTVVQTSVERMEFWIQSTSRNQPKQTKSHKKLGWKHDFLVPESVLLTFQK